MHSGSETRYGGEVLILALCRISCLPTGYPAATDSYLIEFIDIEFTDQVK
ncbi:MAG TPA: hypothetical protein V6C63_21140 [Allocoleopsis sp.]